MVNLDLAESDEHCDKHLPMILITGWKGAESTKTAHILRTSTLDVLHVVV